MANKDNLQKRLAEQNRRFVERARKRRGKPAETPAASAPPSPTADADQADTGPIATVEHGTGPYDSHKMSVLVSGRDRPGIAAYIGNLVSRRNVNISTMKAEYPTYSHSTLISVGDSKSLKRVAARISESIPEQPAHAPDPGNSHRLIISGYTDRLGVVAQITRLLSNQQVNIRELNVDKYPGSKQLIMDIELPAGQSKEELLRELQRLAGDDKKWQVSIDDAPEDPKGLVR